MALGAVCKHLGSSWKRLEASWQHLMAVRKRPKGLQGRILETFSIFHGSRGRPRILGTRPVGLIGQVLAVGGRNQEGGNKQVGQDPRAPGLLDRDPIAPGLLDRGKDYASQSDAPGKQGPADFLTE